MTEHTRPEMAAERVVCARIRERIRNDPCSFCVHRIEGWGLSGCSLAGRRYPQCLTDGRKLQFTLDESTIKRAA